MKGGRLLPKLSILLIVLLISGLVVGCVPMGGQAKGWSACVVSGNEIFLGSMEGRLVTISTSSGNILRSIALENGGQGGGGFNLGCAPSSSSVAVYGTPGIAGELIYVTGYNGRVYAYNLDSGATRWLYPREGKLRPVIGGPVVYEGKIYIGSSSGVIYALNAATGDKEWEFVTEDKVWATPAIENGILFAGSFDKKVYAIDTGTGKAKWPEPFETQGAIISSPLIYNNTVYVGSFDRYFYAIDAVGGSLRWRSAAEAGSWFWAQPVTLNNSIYAPCLDGKVYIFDARNGREAVAAIDMGSPISSSPVVIGNSVIVATEEGKIYAINSETNVEKQLIDLEEKINASLCASGEIVYIHTQEPESLYALDAVTGVSKWRIPLSNK